MDAIPWIMISIAILLVIGLFVFVLAMRKQKKRPTDYYNLFIMGIIWTAFGVVMEGQMYFFILIGLVFMAIGITHKKEWKKNRVRWKDLNKKERKFKKGLMIILGILVLVGLVLFFLSAKGIF